MDARRGKGRLGEDLAAAHLARAGYEILARNYRALGCELDIIAQRADTLVFAEVKARRGCAYGLGREAVGLVKQEHLIRAAQAYLQANDCFERFCRFDVLEVDLASGRVEHIEGAFTL
ncbi:MAG: YraN family protein [Candidatus Pelethousia sp.]|nr:YraN family protein [Candidatus Pelethousia sp.]